MSKFDVFLGAVLIVFLGIPAGWWWIVCIMTIIRAPVVTP